MFDTRIMQKIKSLYDFRQGPINLFDESEICKTKFDLMVTTNDNFIKQKINPKKMSNENYKTKMKENSKA